MPMRSAIHVCMDRRDNLKKTHEKKENDTHPSGNDLAMVMERRKPKSPSQLPTNDLTDNKRRPRRRGMSKNDSKSSTRSSMELVFGAFAVCFIIAYSSLSSSIIDVAESQTGDTYHRVLFQTIQETKKNEGKTVPQFYLPQRPRTFGYYFGDNFIGAEQIDSNVIRLYPSQGTASFSKRDARKQEELLNSEDYDGGAATPLEHGDCVAQHEWQNSFYSSCNHLMEQDLTNLYRNEKSQVAYARYLAHGYWRDVWTIKNEANESTVLKTIRYEHDFTPRNFDRHRRDAVAMERLTSSPYILDIYAFCGNSGIFEYAAGGDLEDSAYYGQAPEWTPREKLVVAHQVASGMSAVHHFEKGGIPAIAHTDISPGQFVYVQESRIFKLNDFNRCRFIPWNKKTNSPCPFTVGSNPGIFRAPEEFNYEPETEKVDVYSIGNILYGVLTRLFPFEAEKFPMKTIRGLVKQGRRTRIDDKYKNSTDPYTKTLIRAIYACWKQDPDQRISAGDLLEFITNEIQRLDNATAVP